MTISFKGTIQQYLVCIESGVDKQFSNQVMEQ